MSSTYTQLPGTMNLAFKRAGDFPSPIFLAALLTAALAAGVIAALALVGPFLASILLRWAESDDARRLACEIGAALEEVAR